MYRKDIKLIGVKCFLNLMIIWGLEENPISKGKFDT